MTASDGREEMDEGRLEVFAVVFADVAGSTALYDQLGDVEAEARVSRLVGFLKQTMEKYQGVIIKTIGDEVMCRFKEASHALEAAVEIQLALHGKHANLIPEKQKKQQAETLDGAPFVPAEVETRLKVRIGMHYGQTIFKENDLFGDTVNVAARMAGLALADQIITTAECIKAGGTDNNIHSRRLNALHLKGKEDPVEVYEVLWQPDDQELTALFAAHDTHEERVMSPKVEVEYLGRFFELTPLQPEMLIGRGAQCDVEVSSSAASRAHAKLLIKRNKVLLVDQSTNGTYLEMDSGEELFLHKEEIPLTHSGTISLGAPSDEMSVGHHSLLYKCEY